MTCPRVNETDVQSDFKDFLFGCNAICNPRGIVKSGSYPDGCTLFVRAMIAGAREEAKESAKS